MINPILPNIGDGGLVDACNWFLAGRGGAIYESLLDGLDEAAASVIDATGGLITSTSMREGLAAIAATGFLGATAATPTSPAVLSPAARLAGLERIGRRSNELAFLCQQHHGATALIWAERDRFATESLTAAYAAGERTLGIAASHLRLPVGSPGIVAERIPGGFRLRGHASWATGHSVLDDVLIGARTKDGASLFFILPFESAEGVWLSAIEDLWAMQSTFTVTLAIDRIVEADCIVATDRGGRFGEVHGGLLFQPCCHLLGVVGRTIAHVLSTSPYLELETASCLADLIRELAYSRERFYDLVDGVAQPEAGAARDEMLQLRATITQHCLQLVSTLCVVVGGRSVLERSQLSRLIEETIFFSTTTVNPQVKAALAVALGGGPRRSRDVMIMGAAA